MFNPTPRWPSARSAELRRNVPKRVRLEPLVNYDNIVGQDGDASRQTGA